MSSTRWLRALLLAAAFGSPASMGAAPEVSTDRLIVRLRPAAVPGAKSAVEREVLAARLSATMGEPMRALRVMGDGHQVMQLGRRATPAEITVLAARLARDPEVLEVIPDRLFQVTLAPNDTLHGQQWALASGVAGINAPAAWDTTTGAASQVIGILDTGKLEHAELAGRWIAGYDFVSLAARDTDSTPGVRDGDATDPGDWVTPTEAVALGCTATDSRWHGTAMAGVIAANANNASGIAGINWQAKLLPVRVVGKCGGYESDIADGIRWAAGLAVPGVPANPSPAQLINASLAALGACSATLQGAIDAALAANVMVIASSGNQGSPAASYSPGNCANVTTVGAVDKNGGLPAYANTGPGVALSAPGGVGATNTDAVLTTSDSGVLDVPSNTRTVSANDNLLKALNGTSIAAAHVTGVTSLALAVNPALAPQALREILVNTARPFPTGTTASGSAADCTTSLCGSGMADALAVTRAANTWGRTTPLVESGTTGFLALDTSGTVFERMTGFDVTTTPTDTLQAAPGLSGIVAVSAWGSRFALRADGALFAWGENGNGTLGDGTQTNRTSPVRVLTPPDIVQVTVGNQHAVALKRDASVYAWGANFSGQLGNGAGLRLTVPAKIPTLSSVTRIAAGGDHTLALKGDGTVWGWGYNFNGQVGDGTSGSFGATKSTPVQVTVLPAITRIAAGDRFSMALDTLGRVWTWGANGSGQLGDGTTIDRATPALVAGLTNVASIAAGHNHALAVKGDGTVWAWGENYAGQLGDGTQLSRLAPVQVPGLSAPAGITAGRDHSLALLADGSVRLWGALSRDGVSVEYLNIHTSPFQPDGVEPGTILHLAPAATTFTTHANAAPGALRVSNALTTGAIAAGSALSVAGGEYQVDAGAFTSAPGTVGPGQRVRIRVTASTTCGATVSATITVAGVPSSFFVNTVCDFVPDLVRFDARGSVTPNALATSNAVTITGLNGPAPVSVAGGAYSIGCTASFVTQAGTIANGQSVCVQATASLANDVVRSVPLTIGATAIPFRVIAAVAPATGFPPAVGGGTFYSLALRSDGSLFSWGADQGEGRLGTGPNQLSRSVPVRLTGLSGVKAIAPGWNHALALRSDGTVWAWGRNFSGQLGDGTLTRANWPQMVEGQANVAGIAAGNSHSLLVRNDGTVWTWGAGDNGRLGLGNLLRRTQPVWLASLSGVVAVAAGSDQSFALKGDGTVWAWGSNANGALGDGTFADRWTPVQVSLPTGIVAIAAGTNFALALRGDGTVYAWGANNKGQLGLGTTSSGVTPPQPVPGITSAKGVAAGYAHALVLTQAGAVLAWGANESGQVGDGTTLDRTSPVTVSLSGPAVSIAAATSVFSGHSLALLQDGTLVAWGANTAGELGNANTLPHPSPVPVVDVGGAGGLALDLTQFAAQAEVPLASVRTSNTVYPTGFAAGTAIAVSGGTYSIDGGAFTAANGTINPGQSVSMQLSASASCSTSTSATLTLGALTRVFKVTTATCDGSPARFTFFSQTGVPRLSLNQSNAVTISGINQPVTIAIAGGEYSVSCNGTFVSTSGTVTNGTIVCVRQVASAAYDTLTTATLSVGTESAAFDVMTEPAPAFLAPAAITMGYPALGLRTDGRIMGWGANEEGQLGDGSTSRRYTPVMTVGIGGVLRIANASHSLAVRSDGTVWSWGSNIYGMLGDGTTTNRTRPARIVGLDGVIEAAAGTYHSLAVKSDGTVWAWGLNQSGEVGDGTTTRRLSPVPVANLSGVTKVAAAFSGSLALKADGTVWGWGNLGGQTPVQVAGLANIIAIAAGEGYGLAVRNDGTVWGWGRNDSGQLGVPSPSQASAPIQVPGLAGIVAIAASGSFDFVHHSLAARNDGTVWTWGANNAGQLGDGTTAPRSTPTPIAGIAGAVAVTAGYRSSLVLLADGTLRGFGFNGFASLGNGTDGNGLNATQVLPGPVVGVAGDGLLNLKVSPLRPNAFAFASAFGAAIGVAVTSAPVVVSGLGAGVSSPVTIAGGDHSRNGQPFTSADGVVANGDSLVVRVTSSAAFDATTSVALLVGGTIGQGATFSVRTRRSPAAQGIPRRVALGDSHSYILDPAGAVLSFGYGGNGQLGKGSTVGSPTPAPIAGVTGIVQVAAGAYHGLALKADGGVLAWGFNAAGQLGYGGDDNGRLLPVAVSGLSTATEVSAGSFHSVALKADGTVATWGLNAEGQLGLGNVQSRYLVPQSVPGLSGIVSVAAGGRHTLALKVDGTVVAWGANESGQLGDGSTASRSAPVAVPGLSNVVSISAGGAHSLALKQDGSVWAWGANAFGQLGVGDTASRLVPTLVAGLSQVGLIAAGSEHSAAVKVGGAMFTWGRNSSGQLGEGTNTNRTSPFALAVPSGVVALAAGGRHTAAITAQRQFFGWGDNFFGQVGNRSGNYSPQSASLNVLRGDSVISTGASGTGSGVGTGSGSGSSIIEIDGQATGFEFGSRAPGATSSTAGRYKNASATADITDLGVGVSGSGFNLASSDCPTTLAPSQECSFSIDFNPASAGLFQGELVIASSVAGSPERRALFGAGVAPASPAIAFAKTGLDVPPQTIGTASAPFAFAITNAGTAPLTVTGVTSTLADFSTTHDCGSVAPGATCNLSITFTPRATGPRVSYLSFLSNAPSAPTITVSGTGAPGGTATPIALGRLGNISTRMQVLTGNDVMIGGFIIQGSQPKTVVVRARGPSLAPFGIANFLANPKLDLYSGQTVIATNDDWQQASNVAAIQSSGFAPTDPKESAIYATLTPGAYTAIVTGVGNTTGVGIVEVFEVDRPDVPLANISTRGQVLTNNDVMIGGFIIQGDSPQTVIVRARGPSLAPFGIANFLANPVLQLFAGATQIAVNDNWQTATNAAEIQSRGFAPTNAFESAILVTLTPGAYTAIVTGAGGGTGVGIIEVFAQ